MTELSQKPLYVASPLVPEWESLRGYLQPAMESRRLTNGGPLASNLESRLSEILRTPHVSLVSNGTLAIELAAKALGFKGKVVTTPFTFVATVSALIWIGLEPVFADIDEKYLTLDPDQVENALTEDVTGIVGVHVYGCPCDIEGFAALSERTGLPVLYDGAHIFDTTYNGAPVARFGDATTLSFHATKQFNTGEGGAVVTNSVKVNASVNLLRNFGILSEDEIAAVGTNGKISEIAAGFGLANLDVLFEEKSHRLKVKEAYCEGLDGVPGLHVVPIRPGTKDSTHYIAVRFPTSNGVSKRDNAYLALREKGIFARKYFFPLLSDVDAIVRAMSVPPPNLPNAQRAASEVLVLPLHGRVSLEGVREINQILRSLN